jgi:hypothetical protein
MIDIYRDNDEPVDICKYMLLYSVHHDNTSRKQKNMYICMYFVRDNSLEKLFQNKIF